MKFDKKDSQNFFQKDEFNDFFQQKEFPFNLSFIKNIFDNGLNNKSGEQ